MDVGRTNGNKGPQTLQTCLWLLTEDIWLGKSKENEGYESTFHVEKNFFFLPISLSLMKPINSREKRACGDIFTIFNTYVLYLITPSSKHSDDAVTHIISST